MIGKAEGRKRGGRTAGAFTGRGAPAAKGSGILGGGCQQHHGWQGMCCPFFLRSNHK